MICPNCSTENQAGAKFCRECGQTLAAGCPTCGFVNLPNSKFCSDCGTVLTASGPTTATAARPTATAQPQPSAVAERRLVSVLFADLVGFTPFAEERDSEDVRETLSRYFDTARDVIERYGGTIEKFIGDAVMAVWGAPIAHEDDAERAVRAALELVDAVGGLKDGVQARAGVLTGEAAVTVGQVGEGMVVGDIVNTASRLQSVAEPGTVVVGEQTQLAASAAIAFERVDDQTLKGKTSPVPAWRALRVVAEVGGRNRSEGLEAPFVGRQEEMRLLKELFHATGREKRVRVMSVIGPAGIGKSRLAWEFLKYIDGLIDDVWWHSGRSPAYGQGISFWALGEMVRERCKLRELDDETTTRARVAATVEEFVPDVDEREWIAKSLLTLLGIESGMAADQLFGAWRTFFERISEKGTVVLVFEDMHFADTGLLDFVDHLLDFSRGLPIYVVTLARPDLIERRQNWGAGKRNFNSLYLEPLNEADMRELLAGLVPGLPEAATASIVARADGIPLYAVETVRTLLAEGKLVNEGGVCVPKGNLSSLAVPATLTALISARLDALDEIDRRITHDAAVLGQSFSIGALAAVSGIAQADLGSRLDGLVRRELLQHETDARSPERGQYAFVQALIREVAYNTLSKHDRKRLHLAAARYFESLGSDEIAGALASHYLAAHANSAEGAEADALAGQARIALKAAAGRASALGSFDQAVVFLRQAMTVTTDTVEEADLLEQAALAARLVSHWDEAEEMLVSAVELRRQAGDRVAVARVTAHLGLVLGNQFKFNESVALVEAAIDEFADLADDPVMVELKVQLARVLPFIPEHERALLILEEVLPIAERRDLVSSIATAFLAKGNSLFAVGRRREGAAVTKLARETAAEHGLTDTWLRATGNLAAHMAEQDIHESLALYREAADMARRLGHRGSLLTTIGNIGYSAYLSGDWDYGLTEMESIYSDTMSPRDGILVLNNLLVIRAARGESIDDGLLQMERFGKEMSGTWHLFVSDPAANAAMARGDFESARRLFYEVAESEPLLESEFGYRASRPALWTRDLDNATRLADMVDRAGGYGPLVEARRTTLRAGIAALEGRPAEALALYRDALAKWRSSHSVWDEALSGIDMAILLDPAEPEVAAVVASTRATIERLRAQPYLERLDAAVAQAQAPSARAKLAPVAAEVATNS